MIRNPPSPQGMMMEITVTRSRASPEAKAPSREEESRKGNINDNANTEIAIHKGQTLYYSKRLNILQFLNHSKILKLFKSILVLVSKNFK